VKYLPATVDPHSFLLGLLLGLILATLFWLVIKLAISLCR
jgi:uncharacterized membrane protein YciS (DUF1049 family)